MTVIGWIRLRIGLVSLHKAVGRCAMHRAGGVPTVGRVVVAMIVLAYLQDAFTFHLMGLVPVDGMPRALERDRRGRDHSQERSRPDSAEAPQLSVPVNMAAACSWLCRML